MDIMRCLSLPIQKQTLMVPYSAVAEIVSLGDINPKANTQDWILGEFAWRGLNIPLICLERINATTEPYSLVPSLPVVILNRISESSPDFVAMILQGLPIMNRFRTSEFELVSEKQDKPYLLMEIKAKGKSVFIPNLIWIEETVSQEKAREPRE